MAGNTSVPEGRNWHVSKTCDGGACVKVAPDGDAVLLSSTTQPDGPTIAYTRAEWQEFVAGIRRGDFDDLF